MKGDESLSFGEEKNLYFRTICERDCSHLGKERWGAWKMSISQPHTDSQQAAH